MALQFTTSYLEDSLSLFRQYKKLAEGAMEQVTDEQLFTVLDEEMNSIAIVVKHMAGNMRSRWTDFLTTDGEKPDRDRDSEFVDPPTNARSADEALGGRLGLLIHGARAALRGGPHSHDHDPWRSALSDAGDQPADSLITRITAARLCCWRSISSTATWRSLTVPRAKSAEFNKRVLAGEASQR